MASRFITALVPPAVRLAGRRLGPLTLGHCALLEAVGSPFAPFASSSPGSPADSPTGSLDSEGSAGHNALAWYILTRPWAEARDRLDSRRAGWSMRLFGLRRMLRAGEDADALSEWLDEQVRCPRYTRDAAAGEGSRGAHPLLILVASLMEHHGSSIDEALATPVAIAWQLHLAHWEEQGAIRITPEGEIAALDLANLPHNVAATKAWAETQAARHRTGRPYDAARDTPPPLTAEPPTEPATSNVQPATPAPPAEPATSNQQPETSAAS